MTLNEAAGVAPNSAAVVVPRWYHGLLGRQMQVAGLVTLAASFFLPQTGLGVDVCPIHAATGLPCPGCGMTRAVTMVSHGDVLSALGAHPFVVLVWPMVVLLAVIAVLPAPSRGAIERFVVRHEKAASFVYRVVLFSFAGFGLLRLVYFLVRRESFP